MTREECDREFADILRNRNLSPAERLAALKRARDEFAAHEAERIARPPLDTWAWGRRPAS